MVLAFHIWKKVSVRVPTVVVLDKRAVEVVFAVFVYEGKARAAYDVMNRYYELVRVDAILFDFRYKDASERRFAVCHIFIRHDVQDAVVGERNAGIVVPERVAVV